MKKTEMADLIYAMLGEILAGSDFHLRKRDGSFERKISAGRQNLSVPLWDHSPSFDFSLDLTIRLDPVEAIFNRFNRADEKYHALTVTTITHVDHFASGFAKIRVTSADDVRSHQARFTRLLEDKILPFCGQHQTIEQLDAAVNVRSPSIDVAQNPAGAMHAVILARLANNPKYSHIVARHRRALGGWFGHAPPEFEALVKYLEDYQAS